MQINMDYLAWLLIAKWLCSKPYFTSAYGILSIDSATISDTKISLFFFDGMCVSALHYRKTSSISRTKSQN